MDSAEQAAACSKRWGGGGGGGGAGAPAAAFALKETRNRFPWNKTRNDQRAVGPRRTQPATGAFARARKARSHEDAAAGAAAEGRHHSSSSQHSSAHYPQL